MKLVISATLHTALRRHLEGTFPNEGGGFLIGQQSGDGYTVVETRFVENTFESEEQYHRYLMEEGAYQQAEDYADEHGLLLMGYFHSHPNHPAIPSEFDRVNALPKFLYLIVSVQDGQAAESNVWELTDSRDQFQPVSLEEIS
jgi:proteasome lid subunit RPN8/RPN11